MTTDDIRKELNQIDERTHRKLVHYIQTRCCPEDIAEECVQYAYLQALVQAKKTEGRTGYYHGLSRWRNGAHGRR